MDARQRPGSRASLTCSYPFLFAKKRSTEQLTDVGATNLGGKGRTTQSKRLVSEVGHLLRARIHHREVLGMSLVDRRDDQDIGIAWDDEDVLLHMPAGVGAWNGHTVRRGVRATGCNGGRKERTGRERVLWQASIIPDGHSSITDVVGAHHGIECL